MTTPWWSAKWSGHPQAHRLRVHRRGTRSRHAVFLPAILQPLLEFPPAVRRAGAGDQGQRKGTETVPLVCHSLGNPAPVAGRSGVPEGRFDDPGDGRPLTFTPDTATRSTVAIVKGEVRRKMVADALNAIDQQIRPVIQRKKYVVIKVNNVSTERQLAATHADTIWGILDYLQPKYK